MSAVEQYKSALDRLKSNKPIIVPKGTAINKDTVAMEAGNKRGSIRNRSGFEQLITDIETASENTSKRTDKAHTGEKLAARDQTIEELKAENELLKTRYMSLLYQNYELAHLIQKTGIKAPKYGTAKSLTIIDNSLLFKESK